MLIPCVLHIRPEGHREPRSEVGSLSPAERLVWFERELSDSDHNVLYLKAAFLITILLQFLSR